ncbi:MAG: peptidoglycan DD-metalloendopeptidase family protein [Bacteroidia bacterium]
MKYGLVLVFAVFLSFNSKAQNKFSFPVDTVMHEGDSIVIFSDKTWEYLNKVDFDGVLNEGVLNFSLADSSFNMEWNSDVTFNRQNYDALMKDSLWLCTIDSINNAYCVPFSGRVTSRFGKRGRRYHQGIDIDLNTGDSIKSAFDGVVRYSRYNSSFGYLVIIRHFNGIETYYAHLSKLMVVPNQDIKAGQVIGLGGNTGKSYGSHLHFETRFMDKPFDPETIFDFETNDIIDENLIIHQDIFKYKHASNSVVKPMSTPTISSNVYHRVRSGDTLYGIARKHGTTVQKICQLNNIKSSSTLKIGRTLRVK